MKNRAVCSASCSHKNLNIKVCRTGRRWVRTYQDSCEHGATDGGAEPWWRNKIQHKRWRDIEQNWRRLTLGQVHWCYQLGPDSVFLRSGTGHRSGFFNFGRFRFLLFHHISDGKVIATVPLLRCPQIRTSKWQKKVKIFFLTLNWCVCVDILATA